MSWPSVTVAHRCTTATSTMIPRLGPRSDPTGSKSPATGGVSSASGPQRVFRAAQARRGYGDADSWILDSLLPQERARPMVTVLDGHPHTLAFLAGVCSVPATHLGVTGFGQSGDLEDVYRYHGLDTDSIIAAALDLVD